MLQEYMLVATKISHNTGERTKIVVIDRVQSISLKEAEAIFQERHNFNKLLPKNDLTIVKSERFYQ